MPEPESPTEPPIEPPKELTKEELEETIQNFTTRQTEIPTEIKELESLPSLIAVVSSSSTYLTANTMQDSIANVFEGKLVDKNVKPKLIKEWKSSYQLVSSFMCSGEKCLASHPYTFFFQKKSEVIESKIKSLKEELDPIESELQSLRKKLTTMSGGNVYRRGSLKKTRKKR